MNKKGLVFVICWAVLLSAGLIAKPGAAFACSCAMAPSPEQVKGELERKTAVFAGKVTQVAQPKQKKIMSTADLVKVSFEVSTVWKGELKQRTVVYTANSSASCGYESFQEGEEYLVSAYGTMEQLETGICEMTRPLEAVSQELKLLGEGYPPLPVSAKGMLSGYETGQLEAPDSGGRSLMPAILTVSISFIVSAIAIWLVKRRNRSS